MMAEDRAPILRAALGRLRAGAFDAAAKLVEPLYHADPADLESLLLLGLALGGCGHPELAADLLDEVARRRPDAPHPAIDLLSLLRQAGREAAIAPYFAAAGALAPEDHRLHLAEGEWRLDSGQGGAARAAFERALALRPDFTAAEVALASLLAEEGHLGDAIGRFSRLLARGEARPAVLNGLGVALGVAGRFPEAAARFEEALRQAPADPQIHENYGMALLRAGRLAEGWAAFDRRHDKPGRRLLPAATLLPPLEEGVRLDGRTVVVTADYGLGDMLQFARYLPMLAARGARVLVWVPEPLRRLLGALPGVAAVLSGPVTLPRFDWHCPFIRLAQVFGTTLDRIPAGIPYLAADPALARHWAGRLPPRAPGRRRIGLVWAGSERADPGLARVDGRRSLPLAQLAPLGGVPGIDWVSLQLGDAARAQRPPPGLLLHDPMGEVRDLADTAGIVAGLDAVVTVDTAVAHLAGAMGVRVLLLDRYDNCWRWLAGREDSPWYPTLRIFRQARWGDWDPVVRRVAAVLAAEGTLPEG